ncbi:MAG TPA: ubiquinol-cytochrome c reductase iron-sulfur subunit [Coleofasciculaceae cyanobacterium]
MNRREFIGWVGVGGIASFLPIALVACSPKPSEPKTSVGSPRADGFQPVGTVADLDKNGQILNEQFSAGSLLVIRNPADKTQAIAVNPTCPHAGCTVAWQQDQTAFVCPCHGSKFASNGSVQQGPANKPLSTYTAKLEDNSVLVKAN